MKNFTKTLSFFTALLFAGILTAQDRPEVSYEVNPDFSPIDSNYYSYNAQDVLLEKRTSKLIGGTWRNYKKINHSVNSQGDVESTITYIWVNNAWSESDRIINTYDNGKLTVSVEEVKSGGTTWVKTKQNEYTYDGNGNIDSLYIYKIDGNGNKEKQERVDYIYLSNGNMAERSFERWKNGAWEASKKWVYIYDFTDQIFKLEEDNYIGGQWHHIHNFKYNRDNNNVVRSIDHINSATGQKIDMEFFKYEGETTFLSASEIDTKNTISKVYPNPFRNKATLSWEGEGLFTVTVKDLNGRTISTHNNIATNSFVINGEVLKQGVYFYTIENSSNGATSLGKFVLTK